MKTKKNFWESLSVFSSLSGVKEDMKDIENKLNVLNEDIQVKNKIIEVFQTQLYKRENMWKNIVNEKQDMMEKQAEIINNLEGTALMFYNVLYKMKDVESVEEVEDILDSYSIDFQDMPFVQ